MALTRIVHDCATGEQRTVQMSPEEEKAHHAMQTAHATQIAAEEAETAALRAAVTNHPDPVVQALARRLGLA
jgi:hypothetical protein